MHRDRVRDSMLESWRMTYPWVLSATCVGYVCVLTRDRARTRTPGANAIKEVSRVDRVRRERRRSKYLGYQGKVRVHFCDLKLLPSDTYGGRPRPRL